MIIGFIGFGKVAVNLVKLIKSDNIEFVSSTENRSLETVENIEKSKITILDDFMEVAIKSDLLISANSPNNALEVAKKYAGLTDGIYLDLNNISPKTSSQIDEYSKNFVKGAIIGKIDSDNPIVYLSGPKASDLLFLNDFLNVRIIEGDVSKLKLLRSSYTKAISAILIETCRLAKNNDLEDEFFEILSLTEGEDFKQKSVSRIENTINYSKRKSEELEEIIDYFNDDDLIILKTCLEKLRQL